MFVLLLFLGDQSMHIYQEAQKWWEKFLEGSSEVLILLFCTLIFKYNIRNYFIYFILNLIHIALMKCQ